MRMRLHSRKFLPVFTSTFAIVIIALCTTSNLSLAEKSPAIKVTLLGTGSPTMRTDRFGPSILVEANNQVLLFDAGRGAALRLHQVGIPYSRVNKLFLTHLHSDHINGIVDLWLTGWVLGRHLTPLRVWGPEGTAEMFSHLEKAFSFDINIRSVVDTKFPTEGVSLKISEIKEGLVYQQDGVSVTAFEVDHSPIKPAFGFRIEHNGRSVTLSGDTKKSVNLIKYAKGTDLLIHEVATATPALLKKPKIKAVIDHHTTPQEAGEVFSLTQPKLAIYSHIVTFGDRKALEAELVNDTRATYSGPLVTGKDLMVIEIGKETRITN